MGHVPDMGVHLSARRQLRPGEQGGVMDYDESSHISRKYFVYVQVQPILDVGFFF